MGSFAVWGTSRPDLDRLAWSVAVAIDPEFVWVELTEGHAPPGSRELEVLEEIGLDRIERIDRADLLIRGESARHDLGARDAPGPTPGPAEFPPGLAERIDHRGSGATPRSLILSNLDRTLALAHDPSSLLNRLLRAATARRVTLIATVGLDPAPGLDPFECVVHVSPGEDGNTWNPVVDWTSRSAEATKSVPPPPGTRPKHRDVLRHLRAHRPGSG